MSEYRIQERPASLRSRGTVGCLLAMVVVLALAAAAMRADERLAPREGCAQIQSVGGVPYTVDTCTGTVSPPEMFAP